MLTCDLLAVGNLLVSVFDWHRGCGLRLFSALRCFALLFTVFFSVQLSRPFEQNLVSLSFCVSSCCLLTFLISRQKPLKLEMSKDNYFRVF